jgi:hypothetical protein
VLTPCSLAPMTSSLASCPDTQRTAPRDLAVSAGGSPHPRARRAEGSRDDQPVHHPDGERNPTTLASQPTTSPTTWGPWSKILEGSGYSPEAAKAAASQVLPDILHYDPERSGVTLGS